jgi:hypothetical protein
MQAKYGMLDGRKAHAGLRKREMAIFGCETEIANSTC